MLVVAAVAVTLYLGGWHLPGLARIVDPQASPNLYAVVGLLVFAAKMAVIVYAFMWFRWTFPRYRYDQLMDLGWKWLTPAALANIVLTGVVYTAVRQGLGLDPGAAAGKLALILGMFAVAAPVVLLFVGYINRRAETFDIGEQRRRQLAAREERRARIAEQKA